MPYDTRLSPHDEQAFQQWAAHAQRLGDLMDYDLRGAWKTNAKMAANGHLPDTFKKPNHPTFSRDSQYSTPQHAGGDWVQAQDGKWVFAASPLNMSNMGPNRLSEYFNQVEPDASLLLPIDWRLR
jgi:hypothetical protein